MTNFTNPRFYKALFQDTIGQDDKAMETLGADTFEEKQTYDRDVALLCAAVAVLGAVPTYGISLFLLLVSWRKWVIIQNREKKHAANAPRPEVLSEVPQVPGAASQS